MNHPDPFVRWFISLLAWIEDQLSFLDRLNLSDHALGLLSGLRIALGYVALFMLWWAIYELGCHASKR